jgi:hypothetical protein
MKIDYNKREFSLDERKYMMSEVSSIKDNSYVPILVQLDSNILKLDKQKFLVSDDIRVNDFVNGTLRKKLINLDVNDVLNIKIVRGDEVLEMDKYNKKLKEIYMENKDVNTKFLILRVSRVTTYKVLRGYMNYFLGY